VPALLEVISPLVPLEMLLTPTTECTCSAGATALLAGPLVPQRWPTKEVAVKANKEVETDAVAWLCRRTLGGSVEAGM
jgi:hypothetical protein